MRKSVYSVCTEYRMYLLSYSYSEVTAEVENVCMYVEGNGKTPVESAETRPF